MTGERSKGLANRIAAPPAASESLLVGDWVCKQGEMHGDDVCQRIQYLLENHFIKMASSKEFGAWEILYLDPTDGRFWELTYPDGSMHGGGAPQIEVISESLARGKYQFT